MMLVHRRPLRWAAPVLALGLLGAACGGPSQSVGGGVVEETTTTTIARGPDTTAAQLRSQLSGLLTEHVHLASAAAGAALGGRPDEFAAAASALEGNSASLAANFEAVFGTETGQTFAGLWTKHVGFFVAYIEGLATGNGGKSAQAVADLTQYARDFGAFINSALPSLPAAAVTASVATHVQTLKAVVDAKAARNQAKAFADERAAAAHMATVAATLTGAMAEKDPDKIGGDPRSGAADLLSALNTLLREHVFLASAATGAAVGGRGDEFAGAAAALTANSGALTGAVAGVYGAEAGTSFSSLWKEHIDLLVDYTQAVAGGRQAQADEAMGKLLAYPEAFGAFINEASPRLTAEAVAGLVKTHLFTLKDVVDAQAAKGFTKDYTTRRAAADHMGLIANSLASAIVDQFPDKF